MSRTSERRLILGMTPMGFFLVVLIAVAAGLSGLAIGLLTDQRDSAENSRDAVAGQSQQLVECLRDPATTQSDCEQKVDEVQKTIDDAAPGADGRDGNDGQDGQAGQAGDDGEDGADGADGARGPRGPRGFVGPVGPAGAPGSDGSDGQDGANGTDGSTGEPGPAGPPGPQGDRGATGATGADGQSGTAGADGRGVERVECDPETQQFVVVYDDGTSQTVEGSDCSAGLIDPVSQP